MNCRQGFSTGGGCGEKYVRPITDDVCLRIETGDIFVLISTAGPVYSDTIDEILNEGRKQKFEIETEGWRELEKDRFQRWKRGKLLSWLHPKNIGPTMRLPEIHKYI